MYECFRVGLILQTSVNMWDPSEEPKHKWDPVLSLSYEFTVTRCSWLPLGCLVLPGKCVYKALLRGGDVMTVKDCFVLAFACLTS